MTPDMIVSFVRGIWPLYTNGDQVDVEVLSRAETCPVRGMVMWNRDTKRWVVFLDDKLTEPRSLLGLLGHELGHIVEGHLGKTDKSGSTDAVNVARRMFTGEESMIASLSRRHWQAEGRKAETRAEESEASEFAAKFVRDCLPLLEKLDRLGQLIAQAMMRTEVRNV